ncbi:MAG: ParB/RepB/Spo0J family partition protein [Clostridia bacterium]|nr:ParB/RepB/Spo0J family partition protein [Clostridia bacterium]
MTEVKDDVKREKVRIIPIHLIDDFPEHPFQVKDDDSMAQLVSSIEMNGILNPVILRRKEGDRYEIIAGHRRKYACSKLDIRHIPAIVRELSRDEAVIEMVDSNLQREHILPSEKARAYKMKMDAMKQQGKRNDLTSAPLVQKLPENTTRAAIAAENGESHEQVRRYIRLNELTPELLEFVDQGKIGMRPAVELSYLQEDEMRDLVDLIDDEDVFPSHAQTIRMKALSKEGKLDADAIREIMHEEKPNQKPRIKIPMERIERFFPSGTSQQQMEDIIVKALAMYHQRQRANRDAR